MSNNINKGESYKIVLSKMKSCSESEDIFHLIGLIAACESIISDRLSAFLGGIGNKDFKNKTKSNFNVSFGNLISYSKEQLSVSLKINSRYGGKIHTENLYAEIWAWKEKRNEVVHAVCKSKNIKSHKSINILFSEVQLTCIQGHRLLKLLLKWSQQTKNKLKKIQK